MSHVDDVAHPSGDAGRTPRRTPAAQRSEEVHDAEAHASRRSGRRRVTGLALALVSLGVAALCSLMWVDAVAGNVIPVLQALTPVWVVLAGVLALVTAIVRTRASLVALIPLLVSAVAAGVALNHHPSVPTNVSTTAGNHHLRVLSLNAEFGEARPASVMAAVKRANPDVVVFLEMTTPTLSALDDAGLAERFPHRSKGMRDDGSRGSVVLSRFPVETLDPDSQLGPWDLQMPTVRVQAPGASVLVRAVHTYPPLQNGAHQWRPQLLGLGEWQRAQDDAHLVMAGDFNASQAHPAFRMLSRGMLDAYPSLHGAWTPTWPQEGRMPAFSQIDHILTRGFVPEEAGIIRVDGTDHAAVWSDLRH